MISKLSHKLKLNVSVKVIVDKLNSLKIHFTDLRRKFNYVSLNTNLDNEIKKLSILLTSNEYRSIIFTCNPPKMIKEIGGEKIAFKKYMISDNNQKIKIS